MSQEEGDTKCFSREKSPEFQMIGSRKGRSYYWIYYWEYLKAQCNGKGEKLGEDSKFILQKQKPLYQAFGSFRHGLFKAQPIATSNLSVESYSRPILIRWLYGLPWGGCFGQSCVKGSRPWRRVEEVLLFRKWMDHHFDWHRSVYE